MEKEIITIINPENSQKLIEAEIDSQDVAYEKARKELTLTTRFHDWHNTAADAIMAAIDDANFDEEDIKKYNDYVRAFNQYGDTETIGELMGAKNIRDIITYNSRLVAS